MTPESPPVSEWLDSRDFYELCQAYRWAQDGVARGPDAPTAAEAFEELKRQILLRQRAPEIPEGCSVRLFKPCEQHKNVTSWTVHPTDYAIPAREVCPVCEEIAYNKRFHLQPR